MSSQQTIDRRAREAALAALDRLPVQATSLVHYQSSGRVVVIGDNQALEVAPRLGPPLRVQVILTEGAEEPGLPQIPLGGRDIAIEGHLGNFRIHLGEPGKSNAETVDADLILDLGSKPLIGQAMPPPGYRFASLEEEVLQAAVEELSGLVGRFEKPRYFDYDPNLCAHGRAGKNACNRCIEACPAGAIRGLAETIEVDPQLCQGGGICATVCPGGAIRYAYPTPRDSLERLRRLLMVYREQGGRDPVVVCLAEFDPPLTHPLPENYLPFPLEELASAGLEFWLSALAYGARALLLVDGGALPEVSAEALKAQLRHAGEIVAAMGYPREVVALIGADALADPATVRMPEIEPAGYSGLGGKRQSAFLAIDHLHGMAQRSKPLASLEVGAPFGQAEVDHKCCTLCFSCVGACPGKALQSGGDERPSLLFIEENCIQCGLCTRTCPEDAIWITPRLLFDRAARRQPRLLHEEEPFLCTACGKPFATRSVIEHMQDKLRGHAMFQSERARRRLTLCEDCRVIDIVQDQEAMGGGIDAEFPH